MAVEHYEMSGSVSDALHDAAQASPLYSVYEPIDWTYSRLSDSNAYQHLPEVTIDDIRATVSDVLREDRAATVFSTANEKSQKLKLIGKRNETVFSENEDGTYTHIVESGDTYWDVARTVLIAQTGEEKPDTADIQKMMNRLQRYNGKPTSGEAANRLAIGEEIHIPKAIADLVEERQDGETKSEDDSEESADETTEEKKLTAKEKKALTTTDNGIAADRAFIPRDGVYNPFQPPGLEPGRTADYTMEGYYNYDVEGRKTLSDVTNAKTGERKLSYAGQVDSGYGANGIWWNDTPYDASETISANGVVTHREVTYHGSEVKMNFSDGCGNKVDAYVSYVESNLDPSSGNYRTQITTVDGRNYFMQIDGQSGQVVKNSIRFE